MIASFPIEYLANECDHVILSFLFNYPLLFQGIVNGRRLSPLIEKQSDVQSSLCVLSVCCEDEMDSFNVNVFRFTKG